LALTCILICFYLNNNHTDKAREVSIPNFVPLLFMTQLRAVNKYFYKYKWRLILGVVFIIISNYFGILAPQITGYVVDKVEHQIKVVKAISSKAPVVKSFYDPLVEQFIHAVETAAMPFSRLILFCGILLLAVALLRGFFMFLMRQTIIVMSRHIEFDQKNNPSAAVTDTGSPESFQRYPIPGALSAIDGFFSICCIFEQEE